MPTGVEWKRGDVVEVAWTIEANHGGGYIYRIAPADGPLTEETFGVYKHVPYCALDLSTSLRFVISWLKPLKGTVLFRYIVC